MISSVIDSARAPFLSGDDPLPWTDPDWPFPTAVGALLTNYGVSLPLPDCPAVGIEWNLELTEPFVRTCDLDYHAGIGDHHDTAGSWTPDV